MSTSSSPPSRQLPPFLRQTKSALKAKFVDLEWAQRERLLQGAQQPATPNATVAPSQWARLTGEAVSSRNRYLNVEPYASNRVRLRVAEGVNDYINASRISLGERRYIATQGPKDTSVAHFYRMLAAECGSGEDGKGNGRAVVVMLTQTHEAGREKCFQYYPLSEEESPMAFRDDDGWGGEVRLESLEEHMQSRSQVRRMRLRSKQGRPVSTAAGAEAVLDGELNGEPAEATESDDTSTGGEEQELEIHHLLFTGWPDFLIPEADDRAALLKLVDLSAELNNAPPSSPSPTTSASDQPNGHHDPSSPPRIFHCSAGVGRSGTFIALDYLLSLLHSGAWDGIGEGDEQDPVAECVDELRKQRMMMVQGESQFWFLYEVLREGMEERLKGKGGE